MAAVFIAVGDVPNTLVNTYNEILTDLFSDKAARLAQSTPYALAPTQGHRDDPDRAPGVRHKASAAKALRDNAKRLRANLNSFNQEWRANNSWLSKRETEAKTKRHSELLQQLEAAEAEATWASEAATPTYKAMDGSGWVRGPPEDTSAVANTLRRWLEKRRFAEGEICTVTAKPPPEQKKRGVGGVRLAAAERVAPLRTCLDAVPSRHGGL